MTRIALKLVGNTNDAVHRAPLSLAELERRA